MQSRITGTTMPVLEFILDPNESIISEAGELSWMGSSIQMTTHTQFGGGGGLFGVIKRVAGGGSIFMSEYRAIGTPGELAFATKLPGHIVPIEVSPGHDYMIHRQGFLGATPQIQIGVGFQQSLGAGIFGGDGFLLQKSAAKESHGSSCPGNWSFVISSPERTSACIPDMSAPFKRVSLFKSRLSLASRT